MRTMQFTVISVVYIVILAAQLLISRNIDDPTSFIFFINNLILTFHLWWGSFYFLNYLKPVKDILDYFLFLPLFFLLFANIFLIEKPHLWFLAYGLIFSFAIITYKISEKRIKNPKLLAYIENKVKFESPAIILFFVGSFAAYIFSNLNLFFGAITMLFQIAFIIFLVKKKVYRLNT